MSKTNQWELTPKQLQLKRENHYVWANYLKNWSTNNSDVWYTTKKHNIAYDSVKSIAKEKDLYRSQYLSKQHLEVILFLSGQSPKELQILHKSYLNTFLQLQEIEKSYMVSNKIDKKVIEHFEAFKSNTLENIHTAIENDAFDILQELKKQNLKILNTTENMCKFMNFWGHQIARTTPFRDKIIAAQTNQELKGIYKESWWFISYMFGMNIGKKIFETRKIDRH